MDIIKNTIEEFTSFYSYYEKNDHLSEEDYNSKKTKELLNIQDFLLFDLLNEAQNIKNNLLINTLARKIADIIKKENNLKKRFNLPD